MDKTLYDENSISSVDPREHVRLRPGMYCGDTSTPNQLMLELFSNSLDEHNIGHGNKIVVTIGEDGVCSLEDFAQGFVVGKKHKDSDKTILEASFSTMNTSGKYSDDGVYGGSSLGLNGIGSKIVTFLSEWAEVTTYRDNKCEYIRFENGYKVDHKITDKKHHSGTYVKYKPDGQFFGTDKTSVTYFKNFFEDITCLCPNLLIELNEKPIKHDGIEDMLDRKRGKDIDIIKNHFTMNEDNIKLAMTFTSSSSSTIIPYVNYGYTTIGPHITGIKSSITRIFNNWAKENNILGAKDKNLDGNSIQEGMLLVFNIDALGVGYNAQVKTEIVKIDTSTFIPKFSELLELWLDNNPDDAKAILEKAIVARKASEAAKKAREAVKNNRKRANKIKILHPDKLKDAEFLGEESTLLLVEGLSAGASMAVARDVTKYGILMLRGKLINALTNSNEKLLKNEEIQLLFKALGIDISNYNEKDLRYGRIGICVDSDSDGDHIGLLIMSALYHFCPQFIEQGRLCWLRSPLYIVKKNGKEDYYFTDRELDKAKEKGLVNGEVQRCKGLGSLSAEQARNSMFNENQHMDVLIPSSESDKMLEELMGKDIKPRKDYIFNNIDFNEIRE